MHCGGHVGKLESVLGTEFAFHIPTRHEKFVVALCRGFEEALFHAVRSRRLTGLTGVGVIAGQQGGTSFLGEIWYAEADSPTGEWANAIKVVTHDEYSFYNPQLHPGMTPEDSPILLFEATYTRLFSKTTDPAPRHDYNQVLYRLDLDQL